MAGKARTPRTGGIGLILQQLRRTVSKGLSPSLPPRVGTATWLSVPPLSSILLPPSILGPPLHSDLPPEIPVTITTDRTTGTASKTPRSQSSSMLSQPFASLILSARATVQDEDEDEDEESFRSDLDPAPSPDTPSVSLSSELRERLRPRSPSHSPLTRS